MSFTLDTQALHITVNNRLALEVQRHAALQAESASTFGAYAAVVPSVKTMTLTQWWQQWQHQAVMCGAIALEELPARVLSAFEGQWWMERELSRWLSCPQSQSESDSLFINDLHQQAETLMNVPATAKQLYQARQMSLEYLPDDWHEQPNFTVETQLFKTVNQVFEQFLQARDWLDEAAMMCRRLQWLAQGRAPQLLPSRIVLHGFDDKPPFVEQWQQVMSQMGVEIIAAQSTPAQRQETAIYAAKDLLDEAQQAAMWAVQMWQSLTKTAQGRTLRIGIVAPDLNLYKQSLTQALDETLFARQASEFQLAPQNKRYNISLGESLLAQPVVAQAMLSWQLLLYPKRPCSYQQWSRWLISPYLVGDVTQRQQLDAALRQWQRARFCWPDLLSAIMDSELCELLPPELTLALQTLAGWQMPAQMDVTVFSEQLWSVLEAVGWLDLELDSQDFQRRQALEEALNEFAKMQEFGQMSLSAWMSLWQRFLSEQLHQAQTQGSPEIQVMGMLEAGGQSFDALWVLGLNDEQWPRVPSPNPFLPISLQRQLNLPQPLPRSDPERERVYAQKISERLAISSAYICASYPKMQEGAELLPSPLLQVFVGADAPAYKPQVFYSLAQRQRKFAPERLSYVSDTKGTSVPIGQRVRGGTGVLAAQQKCPLMAYLDYRLGARYGLQNVEEQLAQNNQGILVHRVLELFWGQVKNSAQCALLDESQLNATLLPAVEHAFSELHMGLSEGLLQMEQTRILQLCVEWVQMEQTRPQAFSVVGREQKHWITLAGIQFHIVVDRIDQLDSNERMILDYKTGAASINALLTTPIQAPQLAAYLFALEQSVEVVGIGYGLLHSDDGVKFSALVAEEDILPKSRAVQVFSALAQKEEGEFYQVAWSDFLQALRQEVIALAQAIARGEAQMCFRSEDDLAYAGGYLALRLPEVRAQIQAQSEEA